jgi:hypothetical protein
MINNGNINHKIKQNPAKGRKLPDGIRLREQKSKKST